MWNKTISMTCYRVLVILYVTVFCCVQAQEATTMLSGLSDFCLDPGIPAHATRTPPYGVGFFFAGAKVRYVCDKDYKLIGSPILQCVAGGAWYAESDFPLCQAVQKCVMPTISHGDITSRSMSPGGSGVLPGGIAEVVCQESYYLSNEALKTNACGKDGKWAHSWPKCIIRGCPEEPDAIDNGYYTIRGEVREVGKASLYWSGTKTFYSCNSGYARIGNSELICEDGVWTGEPPSCMRECSTPERSPHGCITSRETYLVGSTVKYTCEEGYKLEGDCHKTHMNECERECLATGTWSGSPPVCLPFLPTGFCSDPGTPAHATRCCQDRFQSGDKLSFYCNEGYEKTGSAERTCLDDGSWSGTQPICYPARAGVTGAPQVEGIFLTNTTLTIVIATTGTVLGVLIIVILLSIRQCHYRNRRLSRSLPMRHSHRRANFIASPEDIDRVALIAYANGLEVVLPSYEEATSTATRSRPPSFSETNQSSDNSSSSSSAPVQLPIPATLTPIAQSSRFRLPRIPRNLRLPPPPPLSLLGDRQDNPLQRSVCISHVAEAGVQTQDISSAVGDSAPSSGEHEQFETREDDRTVDTAGLLLLENEIAQVSSRPMAEATVCNSDATEDDEDDDEELLTDLGGPAEVAALENIQSDEAKETTTENSQPPVTSSEEVQTGSNQEQHDENAGSLTK